MYRRRTLSTIAAGLSAALSLTTLGACGPGSGSGDAALTMVAADYGSGPDDDSRLYWDRIARAYEAKHPGITIDVKVYDWKVVDRKVAEMVAAGDAPDIAQIGSYADYVEDDRLYSAEEILNVSAQADFIGSLAEAGEVHQAQFGLPFVSSSRMFFYNKDLFRRAGLHRAPRTWDDVRAAAEALKAVGVGVPYGLPLGPEEAQAEALMWMLGNNGGYTNLAGGYTINSVRNIQALQWVKDNLVRPGLTGPTEPAKTDRQDVFDAFLAGDAGMINGHPTLLAEARRKGIDVGAVPIPGRTGRVQETLGVADWLLAFRQHGHRDQIGDFLEYVYSPANALAFLDEYGLLPVTTSASEAMARKKRYKELRPFIDQLPTAVFYPAQKTSWGTVAGRLKTSLGKAVSPDGVPGTVLGRVQQQAEALDAERE
ncbi:extracellular solute-binding protein [Streptomyces sp. NPDC026673]|uniref:extracellular solute-binding protein n=1 Tax=Streptomyces sp. NPDC026673 TaxID=3155724 RepID=UPI0034008290